jgi:pimeloyl-ACP methyl ester carboxylesterase
VTDRTPLVFLPGLLCDAALFRPQIAGLAAVADATVADLGRDDSIAAMAERALDAAPPRFALAGLSMGGHVAHEIMRQAPERVLRLALLDTSARADTAEQTKRRTLLMAMARQGTFRGVTPRLLPVLIHPDRLADAALTGTITAMAERIGRDGFLRQQQALIGRQDSRGDLALYRCPTLVVVGRQDAVTPLDMAEEMASRIPGAKLAIVEQCGHLPTLERPAETTALLRSWLAD